MKLLLSFFLLCSVLSNAQELSKNPDNNIYEFSQVINNAVTSEKALSQLRELKYVIIETGESFIHAEGSFSHMVMGNFPVEIRYNVIYEFKDDRYRLKINRFVLQDKNPVAVPLEDMKSHTKRWIKKINEKLPDIVKALEIKENTGW